MVNFPSHYFHDNTAGSLISRITFNVDQVAYAASNALLVLVKDSLAVLGLLGWMIYINWQLSMIFLVVIPVIGLLMKMVSLRMRNLSTGLQESMGDMTHSIEEAIKGNPVVKLFEGQDYESERFWSASNRVRRMNLKIIATTAANVPAVQLVAVLALAVIIYIAASEKLGSNFDVSTFVSYFGAMGLLFSPIKRLTRVNEQLQRGLAEPSHQGVTPIRVGPVVSVGSWAREVLSPPSTRRGTFSSAHCGVGGGLYWRTCQPSSHKAEGMFLPICCWE